MNTHTNGANMATSDTRELPGGVAVTVVTVRDLDGDTTAVQIAAPDEPLDTAALLRLSRGLWDLATELDERRAAV